MRFNFKTLSLIVLILCGAMTSLAQNGCIDSLACNYDAAAAFDDGSCTYNLFVPFNTGVGPVVQRCDNPDPATYYFGNQDCLETQIILDPYCLTGNWDNICQADYEDCIGCDDPLWYIPYIIGSGAVETGIPIQGCPDNPPSGYYAPENQACLLEVLQDDDFCTSTRWDFVCQNNLDGCVLGCHGNWHIPVLPGSNPPVYACTSPAGYVDFGSSNAQTCIATVISNHPECLDTGWNEECYEEFNLCYRNCEDAGWYMPFDPFAFGGIQYLSNCESIPADYYEADLSCINQVFSDPETSLCFTDYSPQCENAYNQCFYGCETPSYWIPYEADVLRMVISCDDPGGNYFLADLECMELLIEANPAVTTDIWDTAFQEAYNECAHGCTNPYWLIPVLWEDSNNEPAHQSCFATPGFWAPDQDCVIQAIINQNSLGDEDWDMQGNDMFNSLCYGCSEVAWYLPSSIGTGPPIYECIDNTPDGYETAVNQECAMDVMASDPFCVYNWDFSCNLSYLNCASVGCSYEWACNYSSLVTQDDGSCEKAGCTDPNALNYELDAGCDDGSCLYPNDCAADFDSNGSVNASDLLNFLSLFGSMCE